MSAPMTPEKFAALSSADAIAYAMQGNKDAIRFCQVITDVLHIWDDLIDQDKPVYSEAINGAFYAALITLPRNEFFKAHVDQLSPVMEMSILNWYAANQMENEGGKANYEIAYILRSAYADIVSMAARIVGGYKWANQIIPLLRHMWHIEGYDQYLSNLAAEQESRAAR